MLIYHHKPLFTFFFCRIVYSGSPSKAYCPFHIVHNRHARGTVSFHRNGHAHLVIGSHATFLRGHIIGNIMQCVIGADGKLVVDGKPARYEGLRNTIASFVRKAGNRHLITIQTDADASYDSYFALQNELVAAYAMVRDAEARRRYGKPMAQCGVAERKAVTDACPQHVAENYDNDTKGGDTQ